MSSEIQLNRSKLVSMQGVGSLVINTNGESALVSSLDNWFQTYLGNFAKDLDEFEVYEPRLKNLLKVDKLFMPPDYRKSAYGNSKPVINSELIIPLQRFPSWHYCMYCGTLERFGPSVKKAKKFCPQCKKERDFIQVPFVLICKNGHISDFPWKEWVHADESTSCDGTLSLHQTGGATLDTLEVRCSCGKKRNLWNVTGEGSSDGENKAKVSYVSQKLNSSGIPYKCRGEKPWQGLNSPNDICDASPYAALKNSINVYYPITISALHLPGAQSREINDAIKTIKEGVRPALYSLERSSLEKIVDDLKIFYPVLTGFQDDTLEKAISYLNDSSSEENSLKSRSVDAAGLELRSKEYTQLQLKDSEKNYLDSSDLKIIGDYSSNRFDSSDFKSYFGKINRVTRLRETIVQIGFERLAPLPNFSLDKGKELLFKDANKSKNNWLPAYSVYGEGIFFDVSNGAINHWLKNPKLQKYVERFNARQRKKQRDMSDINLAKKMMIHTLSHIIIDQLSLSCGYNTVAISERLYIDEDQSGVLIYTSSGDSEGTMGGLVRMGKEEQIFTIIKSALEKSRWCSSDPVCTEIGQNSGQGVNHLNGAACHSCAYLPETSCEYSNTYLDRSLLISPDFGFFKDVLD